MVGPLQSQQQQIVPSPITRKPSYEKMTGVSTTVATNINPASANPERTKSNRSSLLLSSISTATALTNATLPQRKSVDFANLPPPSPKRMRQQIISLSLFSSHSPKWTIKRIIDGMSNFDEKTIVCGVPSTVLNQIIFLLVGLSICISHQERINVIQEARHSFNHEDQLTHNEEIMNSVDKALTKHLTYLLYQYSQVSHPTTGMDTSLKPTSSNIAIDQSYIVRLELALTCDALESIYRATSEVVGLSFRRLGPELLHLLISVVQLETKYRKEALESATNLTKRTERPNEIFQNEEEKREMDDSIYQTIAQDGIVTAEGDLLLRKATKILAHFARVGEATKPMAYYPGLLECLIQLTSTEPYDLLPWDARLSALWIMANLACNAENMSMMACTPRLMQGLVDVANRPLTPNDTLEMMMEKLRSRSIASRAILNLSWAPENKILLAENASLLELLANLCILRIAPSDIGFAKINTTIQNIFDTTRQYAVGALRNIAAAPRLTKIALCHYRDGHLLDVLTDAAWNDADQHVKDRALATIHNLAVHDTASIIASRPDLVMVLKDVLLNAISDNSMENIDSTNGDPHLSDGTPRQHAHATLLVLERTITPDMDSYANIRDLLDAVQDGPIDMGIAAV